MSVLFHKYPLTFSHYSFPVSLLHQTMACSCKHDIICRVGNKKSIGNNFIQPIVILNTVKYNKNINKTEQLCDFSTYLNLMY